MRLVDAFQLHQDSLQYDTADVTGDDDLGMALEATMQMSFICTCWSPETYDIYGIHMDILKGAVYHTSLANFWQIPLHKAKNTVQCTMQWGMHTVLHSHSVKVFLNK